MHHLIIGASAAGLSAAGAIRRLRPKDRITIVTDDPSPPYWRVLVPRYISGEVPAEALYLPAPEYLDWLSADWRLGTRVERIDAGESCAILRDSPEIYYDRLLIATGSRPALPRIPGIEGERVLALWSLAGGDRIARQAQGARRAVVIGAGLIGIGVARALRRLGLEVTVVERLSRIMPGQIDETAAGLMTDALGRCGLRVRTGEEVTGIEGDGSVLGVRLAGEVLPADLAIVATGVRPNLELVRGTSIACAAGILVDDHMRTSDPGVYAAGDVAQGPDLLRGDRRVTAIWPAAAAMGRVAGRNMAGTDEAYDGSLPMNSLEIDGLPAVSIGVIPGLADSATGDEELSSLDRGTRVYRKIWLKKGAICGAILVGDIEAAGPIRELIRRRIPIGAEAASDIISGRFGFGRWARSGLWEVSG